MLETLTAPAHLWVPEHVGTAAGEAIDLAESIGMHLDAEQRLALEAILAEKADGKWAGFEAAVRLRFRRAFFLVCALRRFIFCEFLRSNLPIAGASNAT